MEKQSLISLSLSEKLNELSHSFDLFQEQYETRLKTLERLGIEKKRPLYSLKIPSTPLSNDEQTYQEAFSLYLRKGEESHLLNLHTKALTSGTEHDGGGHVIPQFISDHIKRKVADLSPIRDLASVLTISTNTVEIVQDENTSAVGWASETGNRDETDTPKLTKIRIPVHELYARPRVTQRLLDDASIDIESWLSTKIAAKMAQTENLAFIYGDGSEKPKGFLTYETKLRGKLEKGTFEAIPVTSDYPFDAEHAFDILIDAINALKPEYHGEAVWVMSRSAQGAVQKLKDKTGQFLWQPSLGEGTTPTLLGYKVKVVEGIPEITVSEKPKIPIIFGNFKEAYQIVDRAETQVLRDPYSSKPYVEFYTTRRVGGDVINFEALKMIQFDSD